MPEQAQLEFNPLPPAARERIEQGMKQADDNADVRWKRVTDACILAVARQNSEFTADEVVAEIERTHTGFTTHCGSALGPRLKEVAKTLKYMAPTDRVKRSARPASHGNYLKVWESLVFQGVR